MAYYLKLYFLIFKMSLMQILVNRANFVLWSLTHTATLVTMVLFFNSIYGTVNAINGWNQYQTLLVLGVCTLISGIGSMTFFTFIYSFERELASGKFDFRLTKPADILFLSAINFVDIEDMIVIPNGLILIGYSLSKLSGNHLINTPLFIVLMISSLFILFSVMTLMMSLTFKAIRMNSASQFYWSIFNINKYPTKAIAGVSKVFMCALAPIALISSVPAEVLFGRYDWPWIIASPIVAITLFFISRKIFYNALKDYSSASS